MKDRAPPRRIALYSALVIFNVLGVLGVLGIQTSASLAQTDVTTPGVMKRQNVMTLARTAITSLADMMAGRVRFDRHTANAARQTLIESTGSIPKVFQKPHYDRTTRAMPEIWSHWADFELRVETAERAAKRLKVDRLETLRETLPDMMNACLSCHQTYRKPRQRHYRTP